MHFVPQVPQFDGSARKSMQRSPHFDAPPPQPTWHVPITQTSAFALLHALPHAPQWT
jgi:hypothetical protein